MKKVFVKFILLSAIVTGIFVWYLLIGNKTSFEASEQKIIFTQTTNREALIKQLTDNGIISNGFLFEILAKRMRVFEKIKPGKFVIKKGTTALELARILRNNKQANVKFVINKIRTTNDFVKLIAKNFDRDSAIVSNELDVFFKDNNLGINKSNFQAFIIPNTYEFFWNITVKKMIESLDEEAIKFWHSNDREARLSKLKLNKIDLVTIASIVEEETNNEAEKGNIASVYINRINKKMTLGADPTIKFALNDFTLKRILKVHLQVTSPYNTYKNMGLPPGPICTPSIKTIEATLNAPTTNYLFFVANAALNGTHIFTTNYKDHEAYAQLYREAVTKFLANKPN